MINQLVEFFTYPFLQKAIVVGILVSLCSALLGVSLVLKRYSMIGDGLSHITFGALAISAALNVTPLLFSIPIVIISAILLLRISQSGKLKGDSAIAIIATSSLAIGVFIVSKSGSNTDLSNYLFGSILSISTFDTYFCIVLSVIVILLFILFYHKIFAVTFDEAFAKATGIPVNFLNTLIAILTALTIVVGMRLMGTLLISSLIIFSPISAMRICKTFKGVVLASAIISVINFCVGLILSYLISSPTGSTIVIVSLATLIICCLISKLNITKKDLK